MKVSFAILDAARRCFDGKATEQDKIAVARYGDAIRAFDKAKKDRAKAMRKKDQDAIMAADQASWKAEAEMEKAVEALG